MNDPGAAGTRGFKSDPGVAQGLRTAGRPDLGLFLIFEDDGIAHLVFDQPGEKVNKLTSAMLAAFDRILESLEAPGRAGYLRGLLLSSGKPGVFLAGADIAEIDAVTDPVDGAMKARAGQRIFDRLEFLPIPTVAAVNGACVGGGYELVMACTRIVASDDPKVSVGLPEVRLGIIPGFGGTQRLPRRAGLRTALDLILAGRTLDARRALKAGLIDEVVPAAILEPVALARLRTLAGLDTPGSPPPPKKKRVPIAARLAGWALEHTKTGRSFVEKRAREGLAERAPEDWYPAPYRALQSVLRACELSRRPGESRDSGFENEARLAGEMIATPVSKNLVFLFNAANAAKKAVHGASASAAGPAASRAPRIERAGVLGAGVMGAGIARVIVEAGMPVRLKDVAREPLARALGGMAASWNRQVARGRSARRELEARVALVSPTTDWSGFATCDLVVEAIVERLEAKRAAVAEAEAVLPDGAIFATNTSSLLVREIAAGARRPERIAGLHFFNPAPRMPLVEVVAGPATSREVLAACVAFVIRIGKTPVVVRDGPGFLVNRLLMPWLGEALALAEAGADLAEVDAACTEWGLPMGPFRLLDEIGLDIAAHAAAQLANAFPLRAPPSNGSLERLVGAGRFGVKSGLGFYRHPPRRKSRLQRREVPAPVLDEAAVEIVRAGNLRGAGPAAGPAAGQQGEGDPIPSQTYRGRARRADASGRQPTLPFGAMGSGPWAIPHGEGMLDLLLLPMVNEAAQCLADGIVSSARDVDLAMVMGAGFPPFRGGLLRYADSLGAAEICRRLERLAGRHGERFAPVPWLRNLAAGGGRFHS